MKEDDEIDRFDLASQTGWALAEGELGGKPTLIRIRQDLELFRGHKRWPRQLTITWRYESEPTSGMPYPEQSDAMRGFEDALVPALERDKTAILTFVFTSDGLRHWHLYFADIGRVQERLNEALAGLPVFPIGLTAEDDPGWSEYEDVLKGAGLG